MLFWVSEFGKLYGDISLDIDDGINSNISQLTSLLEKIDKSRVEMLRENYSDVYRNIEYSSVENKEFLFEDLVFQIDLACPPGWTFGPEEEFSAVYIFCNEPSQYSDFS